MAARGVDFSDIDAVIQYDAPTDPKTFSHRVGRTARAGRAGRAIILLSRGREEEYITFLNVRKIPLAPHPYLGADLEPVQPEEGVVVPSPPADPDSIALRDRLREVVLTDRDLADRGARALVSSVRAYTKHEASFIFRTSDIDYAALGTAFGLLRLPVMPEVRDWRKRCEKAEKRRAEKAAAPKSTETEAADDAKEKGKAKEVAEDANGEGGEGPAEEEDVPQLAWTDADVEWDALAYADKKREATRLAALKEKQAKMASGELDAERERERERRKRKVQAELNSAWSGKKDKKARKEERREKKDVRAQAAWERKLAEGKIEADAPAPEARARGKKKAKDEESGSESDGMADEYRQLKRELQSTRGRAEKKETGGMFDDLD